MQTTSLGVSRALQKAGFDSMNLLEWCDTEVGVVVMWSRDVKEHHDFLAPAYTLDDLVPALGLDKPWDTLNESKAKMLTRLEDAVYCDGFIPNALASVWLDENVKEQPCEECGGVGTLGPFRDADDEYPCPSCGGNVSHPVDSSVRKCVKIQKAQDAPRKGE